MHRSLLLPLLLPLLALASACDPCFGAPSCRGDPQLSYGGRMIEHRTGRPMAGVRVMFARRSGVVLSADTIAGISASDGFFQLRADAEVEGEVSGSLIVVPPAPHQPYTVNGLRLRTSRTHGEGVFAGSLVVDPFYLFVGEVRDRTTGAIVTGAQVRFERTGGVLALPDTFEATSDENGRFFIELRAKGVGPMHGDAIVTAPGYPRAYRIRQHLFSKYIDRPAYDVDVLKLGRGLQYVAGVFRRGTNKSVPGVMLEFRRTGGIRVQPESLSIPIPPGGAVKLDIVPLEDGILLGDFVVRPPAPFRPETFSSVPLETLDGDTTTVLIFGFGTQMYARMHLRYRANGEPVEEGVQTVLRRRGGLTIDPDGATALVDSTGALNYSAMTTDTGSVLADIEIRLRDPFDFDTIHNIRIPSRLDSAATDFGIVRVGRWLPWSGVVRDAATDAPVAGAIVEFQRTGGVLVLPSTYRTTTATDGSFAIRPLPLRDGAVSGNIALRFGGAYRDTIITGVTLTTSTDDTLRVLNPFRVQRATP